MNQRWKVAIHESAHAVVALALGGTCERLIIYPDGSGFASLNELSPFDLTVARAAAVVAEDVLSDAPAPAEPSPLPVRCEKRDCDSPTVDMAVLAARVPRESVISDERAIAEFCIAGLETEPERWAARYNTIHAIARRVVSDHHQKILAVARALFARGVLSKLEIQKEMNT